VLPVKDDTGELVGMVGDAWYPRGDSPKENSMKRRRRKPWHLRALRCVPFLVGGTILPFTLGNCDPNVQNAVLTGLQTTLVNLPNQLMTAFLQVFQQVVTPTTQSSAKAVFENLHQWFA
jgi:hypothetical protein